jgi:hypothetical protein
MKAWHHPILGPIDPIVRKKQPEKVWKHLYDPAERWQEVCDVDPARLEQEAISAGCTPFLPSKRFPGVHWRTAKTLERHHDQVYGNAYSSEGSHPDTAWAPKIADPQRWVGRTPGAVLIFVQVGTPCRVKTAFRPLPLDGDVSGCSDVHQRRADYKFEKETGMTTDWARSVARQLERSAGDVPRTAGEAWWLALAVGHARLLRGGTSDLTTLRERCEELLRETPRALLDGAIADGALDLTLDRLAEGLKDDEPEELEDALSDLEDLLVVGQVLGKRSDAQRAVDHARELLAWLPAAFETVALQAVQRLDWIGRDDAKPAIGLWLAVEEAYSASVIRETKPAVRPAATLTDVLLPARPPLLERATAWEGRGPSALAEGVRRVTEALFLRPALAPAMGGSELHGRTAAIRAPRVAGPANIRAFALDDEYPAGVEVTDLLLAGDADLWNLERPGQSAGIVLVASTAPIAGVNLTEVLDAAEVTAGAVVVARELTRPR